MRDPLGQRDGEDAPLVDALLDLAEAGGRDELVHLGLRAPAHDPGLALRGGWSARARSARAAGARAGRCRRDSRRAGSPRRARRASGGPWRCRGTARRGPETMPSVGFGSTAARLSRSKASPFTKRAMSSRPFSRDQRAAGLDIDVAVVAQQDRVGLDRAAFAALRARSGRGRRRCRSRAPACPCRASRAIAPRSSSSTWSLRWRMPRQPIESR